MSRTDYGGVGDCYRACVASLLGLPVKAVPHFHGLAGGGDQGVACDLARKWLGARGFGVFQCWTDSKTKLSTVLDAYSRQNPGIAIILHGEALAKGGDINHAVVILDGKIAHDPSGAGIAGPSIRFDNSGADWWMEVIAPLASVMSGCAQDRATGLGPKGASAVGKAETPNG